VTFQRPYAGAEALYVAASRLSGDALRVVLFVRATIDLGRTWAAYAARVPAALRRVLATV
jgi:hypothetical protein